MLLNYSVLKTLIQGIVLIIGIILVHKFLNPLYNYSEGFKNTYNQSGWSLLPPESWKLPQPKLPICTGKPSQKMSSVSTSGYPLDRMVWKKNLSIINNPYEKDINQYAPGLYILENNPKYPKFKGGI